MNFRIDLPNNEVRDLIENKNYPRLIQHDQLIQQKKNNIILSKFHEKRLEFDPTYKYDKNCDVYDTSKKMRIPAWCDRILFSRDPQFKIQLLSDKFNDDDVSASLPEVYDRISDYFSDHRPVIGVYQC